MRIVEKYRVLFCRPLTFFNHQLKSQQGPHFSPHSKAKANYKAQISGKLVTSGISDVATASVHSEKTRLKKMIMIILLLQVTEKPFY